MSHSDQTIIGSRAPKPSYITLPKVVPPSPSLLDFLAERFPGVDREIWRERLQQGKVYDEQGRCVDESTPYRINARLSYYRELREEPCIPFEETILYEDEEILVAEKPHFLPVTPSGLYVNECLLHRLMARTGNESLAPMHRLDRETAGLVLFSKREQTRSRYASLFSCGEIEKQYECVASLPEDRERKTWLVESRIERGEPHIVFRNVPGEINARSRMVLVDVRGDLAHFILYPITGKTHQLRLHMCLIGSQILHDKFYPELLPEPKAPDYNHPLQLLARRLEFVDPLSGRSQQFESQQRLAAWVAT